MQGRVAVWAFFVCDIKVFHLRSLEAKKGRLSVLFYTGTCETAGVSASS